MSISEITGHQSFTEVLGDGKTYTFSALTMADYGEIENVLKNQRREGLIKLMDGNMNLDAVKYIDGEIKKVTAFDDVSSFSGMVRMLCYSVRHKHPDTTLESIANLLDMQSVTRVAGKLTAMVEDLSKNVEGQTTAPE